MLYEGLLWGDEDLLIPAICNSADAVHTELQYTLRPDDHFVAPIDPGDIVIEAWQLGCCLPQSAPCHNGARWQ